MSLLSNFLGTENYDFMESPMFRELVENLKNEVAEEKNKFTYIFDNSSNFRYQNSTVINGTGHKYNRIHRKNTNRFNVYKRGDDKAEVGMKNGTYKEYQPARLDRQGNREVAA